MQRLVDRCWFFDYDGLRYRFKTEPSLRKIVDDEVGLVGKIKAKSELDDRVQKVWKKGVLTPVYFPAEAVAVDDDAKAPKLVILHYDAESIKATEAVEYRLQRKLGIGRRRTTRDLRIARPWNVQ